MSVRRVLVKDDISSSDIIWSLHLWLLHLCLKKKKKIQFTYSHWAEKKLSGVLFATVKLKCLYCVSTDVWMVKTKLRRVTASSLCLGIFILAILIRSEPESNSLRVQEALLFRHIFGFT